MEGRKDWLLPCKKLPSLGVEKYLKLKQDIPQKVYVFITSGRRPLLDYQRAVCVNAYTCDRPKGQHNDIDGTPR